MTKFVTLPVFPLLLLGSHRLFAQQDYVGRFDLFNGFTWFDSPSANLEERGYHLQAGVNLRTWLAAGFDYSVVQGNLTLTPNLLKPALADQINSEISGLQALGALPPGYQVAVRTASTTQTFAAGPQLEFRHFRQVTLFVRPSIGAINESATPHPTDPFTTALVQQLAPSGKKTDWEPFYGVGGGADVNFTRHISIRLQADFVHNSLFSDILQSSRNTVRLSVGPAFHFGKNIAQ
ncbi:MAG TPA: hypothetical protein VG168_06495 [Bryobacteraceae bacterium]|jgi:hypothetical protein|nr:hypothetical protein [Bryobacteraceae bacterium]